MDSVVTNKANQRYSSQKKADGGKKWIVHMASAKAPQPIVRIISDG
jgi:hypothetical protein